MSSERQAAQADNPWWGEHVHRYQEAMRLIPPGSKILDLACGSGFGSHLMAQNGYEVVGADISSETVTDCKKKFSHPKLQFVQADGTQLNYTDQSFDAVVSFETIEHTRQFRQMLQEFKRVLKSNGQLVLSTPNIVINSPGGKVTNPFHTQEWNYTELTELLREIFPAVEISGQHYKRYDEKGFKPGIAKAFESFFYLRGIRKLPLKFQNSVMKFIIGKPMYPLAEDYVLVGKPEFIVNCKTFFAVCRKQ